MEYLKLLEHSFEAESKSGGCAPKNHLEYLGDYIFDFTTYDSDMSALFAEIAVEVCAAINDGKTYDYIKEHNNYKWYLLMCNLPFFSSRIEWGTSIRGAWWCSNSFGKFDISSCGLWDGDEQIPELIFSDEEWKEFIAAVITFAHTGGK